MTASKARGIPAIYTGVNLIAGLISMLPIYLYSEGDGKTKPILTDHRVRLLNDDTGDLFDGTQFKFSIVEDYLLSGNGYAYVDRKGNRVAAIRYIPAEHVSVQTNTDPVFKTASIQVDGKVYPSWMFIRLLLGSRDGASGYGIVDRCNDILNTAYELTQYEKRLVKTGGVKKGFLKSKHELSPNALEKVKEAWARLWKTEDAMVLNDGMDFMQAAATSVEMQLDEHKQTNYNEVSKLLNIPPAILSGTATEDVFRMFIQTKIAPILVAIESACNRALLLESEKGKYYFSFDTTELYRGDIKKRYEAYNLALQSGWMTIDEIRYREDLPDLNLRFVKFGLDSVYYDIDSKKFYTPNTNKTSSLNGDEGLNPKANGGDDEENE